MVDSVQIIVLVTTYNRPELLEKRALKSISLQTVNYVLTQYLLFCFFCYMMIFLCIFVIIQVSAIRRTMRMIEGPTLNLFKLDDFFLARRIQYCSTVSLLTRVHSIDLY